MTWLLYALTFLLGASVGSFVNVLVSRSVAGKDWVTSRSICDHCKKPLQWYDMIPILSFVGYGGRSACCGKPLSWQHPIVEGLFGLLFFWWAVMGVVFFHLVSHPFVYLQPLFWLITGILFVIIVVTDFYYGLIPLMTVYLGSGLVLIYRGILLFYGSYEMHDLAVSVIAGIGAALFLWTLRALTRGRGMGEGDVYLVAWLGLLLGWPRILIAIWISFVVGAASALLLLAAGRKRWGQSLPFGPFLIIGAITALLWGPLLWKFVS